MYHNCYVCLYSWLSLSRTRKGPENSFDIERVRDRERKIGYSLHKGTETLVRDREKFEIEGVRDRENQMYVPMPELSMNVTNSIKIFSTNILRTLMKYLNLKYTKRLILCSSFGIKAHILGLSDMSD